MENPSFRPKPCTLPRMVFAHVWSTSSDFNQALKDFYESYRIRAGHLGPVPFGTCIYSNVEIIYS